MPGSDKPLDNLVSVITPVFNGAKYIHSSVAAVASQSIKVLEHIVIDDGSSDNTLQILQQLQHEYPHLKVLSQRNQGAGVARNAGIAAAEGKYIAFLDSDDGWLKNKLEQQIGFMETTGAVFSYGDYDEVDEVSGQTIASFKLPQRLTYRQLLNGCPIGCLTAAYNQLALGKCYMPLVRRGQDWGLWLAITRTGADAVKYPGNCARYNRLQVSLSKNKLKKMLDVYQIYSTEERLNPVRCGYHLFRHFLYVRKKHKATS
tara:strand:- start:2844 stop:3620 length:777 start_codon:yes stop_codon:yes gene_type:complete